MNEIQEMFGLDLPLINYSNILHNTLHTVSERSCSTLQQVVTLSLYSRTDHLQ